MKRPEEKPPALYQTGRQEHRATGLAAAAGLAVALAWLPSCHPAKPAFSPLPPRVTSIEGHASLRLVRNGETARSRLSFLFLLPERGQIEVHDPVGRRAARLFLIEDQACLVLPSKRAYWQGGREEALGKLLGFDLRPEEMIDILQGRGDRMAGWAVERDSRQRVLRGRRDGLHFEVRRFFGETGVPQLLMFFRNGEAGSLRILRLQFNQPLKKGVLDLSFLKNGDYRACPWDEMESLMRDKDEN